MPNNVSKLSEVAELLKMRLPLKSDIEPLVLAVEEDNEVVVDYCIHQRGGAYDVVFDDRDLTQGLESESFETLDDLLSYFSENKRQPQILDSVNA
ncbi:hypothetical protein [Photobacterium toruni]|uniref:Uncharacterized protein n=1 Tax=Photobacterium toruni TaxID=1935446 RepID=A0A1T4UJC8_9GAMM|nr:hypothetical protein [Photobacterium toruni]SKA52700.1 hypothetical protein CZ814_03330 [Photobacterium toruni]